ncbi:alcohol dehydrogenase [Aphelenchoides avenae]|nr:alcohol dehydrogenase [Aphelenchus avenae]
MGKFDGKVVIVTGSSSGIGRDAAIEFAKEGASVVIHGQSAERLQETKQVIVECGVSDGRVVSVVESLEDETTPKKIVDAAVNNAGAPFKAHTDPESLESFDFLFKVNLRSVVELTQLAMPHLKKTRGNIINVSSSCAIRAFPSVMFYGLTKAALDHFTRTAALKYGSHVRVNSLNPGPIETYVLKRHNPSDEAMMQHAKWVERTTALARSGSVAEMSNILKFLASDEASYVTGACWFVDGGQSVHTIPVDFW